MKHLKTWLAISLLLVWKLSVAQNIYIGHVSGATADISAVGSGALFVSGDISVASGGIYTNDGIVEIEGDIENANEDLAFGTGTLSLMGNTTQTISGIPFKVYDLIINNTSEGGIVLSTDLILSNSSTFTDGIVTTGSNSFIFNAGASSLNASDISHVNGIISKIGNTSFTFPVGDGTKLRTIAISAPTSISDEFSAQYLRSAPSSGTLGTGLNRVSSLEYWDVNRIVGSSEPLVTLSYDATYSATGTVADLRVASLDGTTWTDLGGAGADNLVAASAPSSTFGEFTLGSSTDLNPLPVELISFNAVYNAAKNSVDLIWVTASELNSDYFAVERSINGTNWTEIARIKSAGTSSAINNYFAVDHTPFSSTVYYRLKQTDFNGEFEYSNIQVVTKLDKYEDLQILPNPITSNTFLKLASQTEDAFNLEILNNVGQVVIQRTIPIMQGDNLIFIEMDQLQVGTYYLKMQSIQSYKLITKQIIKIN